MTEGVGTDDLWSQIAQVKVTFERGMGQKARQKGRLLMDIPFCTNSKPSY